MNRKKVLSFLLILILPAITGIVAPVVANAGQTTNQNANLRVYLNYNRPVAIFVPDAETSVRTLNTNTRRVRVNASWYNANDQWREGGIWRESTAHNADFRMPNNFRFGNAVVVAQSRNGRFRGRAQRVPAGQSAWVTTAAETIMQSRSWGMN